MIVFILQTVTCDNPKLGRIVQTALNRLKDTLTPISIQDV